MLRNYFYLLPVLLMGAACARDLSSTVYTSDSTLSLTLEGNIISARPITIKTSDQLGNNNTGILAGGALGAATGANVGRGGGQAIGLVGGAIAGAIAGGMMEGQLGKSDGIEYIVKVDTSKLKPGSYYEGSAAMRNAISSATTSGLVTIIQGKDQLFAEGSHVYVIFSEKRTRIVPAS